MAKHLNDKKYSDLDYLSIEIQLNKGSPPAEIARQLGRDPSGIRKEIKKFGVFVIKGGSRKCTRCLNYSTCTMHYMCDELKSQSICAVCRHCSDAPGVCPYFELEFNCPKPGKQTICNGCTKLYQCKITYRYIAKYAILQHQSVMNFSHRVLKFESLPSDFLLYISRLIKNGISPDIIVNTLPFRFQPYRISAPTLYDYIDKHLIPGVTNMDLRFKVSRASNGHGPRRTSQVHSHQLNGHSIEDLPDEEKTYPRGYAEIDTAVGIAGHAVLFTVLSASLPIMTA